MNIYAGNLDYSLTEDDLKSAFEDFGEVESVKIVKDFETGRGKGFGFVVMPDDQEGDAAIKGLDGTELKGRTLKVNQARPQNNKPKRTNRW